jgi:hypothetical protein
MEDNIKLFWEVYDNYLVTGDRYQRYRLSPILAKIENEGRENQLFRSKKGWDKIIAWQVLRNQMLQFKENQFSLLEGEIIVWQKHWDRDVFISRIPRDQLVSGWILNPGSEYEKGLYLPIYQVSHLIKLFNDYLEYKRAELPNWLKEEGIF